MKILMVNKFLYPNGGSETYIFKIGEYFQQNGHEVQYFGMEHEGRIVGNHAESYTTNMDFHTGKLQKVLYPFKILYSVEARKKIRAVLQDFKPDVVHLNNFNFQLTPSIIYEIKKFGVPIVYTAHDSQLVCPNHLMLNPISGEKCTNCFGGKFIQCAKGKCIHGSTIKSVLATVEGYLYRVFKTYKKIDLIICPSNFLKEKLSSNSLLGKKAIVMHNFVEKEQCTELLKDEYVLYFGRYSKEKGIDTLLHVCEKLYDIPFVFAGNGPLEDSVNEISNIKNVGFQTGEELRKIIAKAKFSVFTSECFENCPFSVMESQLYKTPIIAANIGGVPELVKTDKTGILFESGNAEELQKKILYLWNNKDILQQLTDNCETIKFDTINEYCGKLLAIYQKLM